MLKASVSRSLAHSCCVTNGDCFCFYLPLCSSCDVTWAVFLSPNTRAPGRWWGTICPHSISRPNSHVDAVWWFLVPWFTALPEGPSPLLTSCSSLFIQELGHTQRAVCLGMSPPFTCLCVSSSFHPTPGSLTILVPPACPMLASIRSPGVPALRVCSVLMTPFVLCLLLALSISLLLFSFSCWLGFSVGFMSYLPAKLFYLWVCFTCNPLVPSAWNDHLRLPRLSRSLLQSVLDSSHYQQDSGYL